MVADSSTDCHIATSLTRDFNNGPLSNHVSYSPSPLWDWSLLHQQMGSVQGFQVKHCLLGIQSNVCRIQQVVQRLYIVKFNWADCMHFWFTYIVCTEEYIVCGTVDNLDYSKRVWLYTYLHILSSQFFQLRSKGTLCTYFIRSLLR